MSKENNGGMISTGKTPDSYNRAKQDKLAKEKMKLAYELY
jgi:hypothetical protein